MTNVSTVASHIFPGNELRRTFVGWLTASVPCHPPPQPFPPKHPNFPLRQCPSPSLSAVIWVGLASFAFPAVGFSQSALLFLWIWWLVHHRHHPIWANDTPRDNCRGFWEISIPCLLLESQRRPHPSGCCSGDMVFITARARRCSYGVRWNPHSLGQTMPASKPAFRLSGCIKSIHFLL